MAETLSGEYVLPKAVAFDFYGVLAKPDVVTGLANELGADPAELVSVTRRREAHAQRVEAGLDAVDGAIDFVRDIAQFVCGRVVLATDSPATEVMPFIARHGLGDHFSGDRVITHQSGRSLGPQPFVYGQVRQTLGLSAREQQSLLVIGNTWQGIVGARMAGATTVSIGEASVRSFRGFDRPEIVVHDYADLRQRWEQSSMELAEKFTAVFSQAFG